MKKRFFSAPVFSGLLPLLAALLLFLGSGLAFTLYESFGFLSRPDAAPTLQAYREVLSDAQLAKGLAFGLYLSVASSALAVAGGTGLALLFDSSRILRRRAVSFSRLPVALPHVIAVVALSQFLTGTSWPMRLAWHLGMLRDPGEGLLHALPGLGVILVYVWKGLPFVLIVVSERLAHMDRLPVDAARDLGATAAQATFSVTLPLLKKTLPGCFVLLAAFSLCSFEVPFLIGPTTPRTLPVAIFALYGTPGLEARASAMAASVILISLSLALFGVYRLCFDPGEAPRA